MQNEIAVQLPEKSPLTPLPREMITLEVGSPFCWPPQVRTVMQPVSLKALRATCRSRTWLLKAGRQACMVVPFSGLQPQENPGVQFLEPHLLIWRQLFSFLSVALGKLSLLGGVDCSFDSYRQPVLSAGCH